MSHTCEDCGGTFETLTRLRLHDCTDTGTVHSETPTPSEPVAEDPGAETVRSRPDGDIDALDAVLEDDTAVALDGLFGAIAVYESALVSARDAARSHRYRTITDAYSKPLVEALDEATRAEGWAAIEPAIEAYHPETSDVLPHVSPVIENVAARYLIRTRTADGIEAVQVGVLEYFEAVLTTVDESHDIIREGVHPYGWGIDHPDHDVADRLHTLAETDVILAGALLEHAFYADQYAAVDLLEELLRDESVRTSLSSTGRDLSAARVLFDAAAGAASEFTPTMPRYWDWQDELGRSFEMADDVRSRVRTLVVEAGIWADSPGEWELTDLMI